MIASVIAATVLGSGVVRLEAEVAKPVFTKGERVMMRLYAVNETDRDVVMGKPTLGHIASGNLNPTLAFLGTPKPELNVSNPFMGQYYSGSTVYVLEHGFVKVPAHGKAEIFYQELIGEWKDGYSRNTAPQGIEPINIPARTGDYRFAFTFEFNRKKIQAELKEPFKYPAYDYGDIKSAGSSVPKEVVYKGDAKSLFESAVEGRWTVSGGFKIVPR